MRRLMFALGVALSLPAWGQAVGPEFQVNTYTTQDQYSYGRAVASDASGNFVVVWQGRGPTGLEIRGQRFAADGSLQGSEFQVNTYTSGYQYRASVARNASGEFMVVWQDQFQDGDGSGVFGQAFAANGTPQGSQFQLSQTTLGTQSRPKVAATGDGTFITSWISPDVGTSPGVFARRFDADGAAVGGQFAANTYTTGNQYTPAVAGDGSGGFVVAWSGRGASDTAGVFARRFNNSDLPLSAEFRVNTYTTGTQYVPAVGVAADGDFVVAWGSGTYLETGQDGSLGGIRGQRFDNVGTPQGSEFQVNTYTSGYQVRPAIGVAANGRFVVAWTSAAAQDGSSLGVFGQFYDPDGTPNDAEFRVNSYTTSVQSYPSIGIAPDGRFVVAWNSYTQDGDVFGVRGQRFTLGGDATPPVVVVSIPNGGETWAAGSTQTIVWTATDETGLDHFEVFLARDGGTFFDPTPICTATQPDQSCDWLVTAPATTKARVKVVAFDTSGNTGEDVSDANFSITSPSLTVTAPDAPGIEWRVGSNHPIQYLHTLGKNQPIAIEINRDFPAGSWETIVNPTLTSSALQSHYTWTVTGPVTPGATARIRIRSVDIPGVQDTANANFTITSRVRVTAPNSNVKWKVGTTKSIVWNHNYPTPHAFRVDLDRDGDLVCESPLAANVSAATTQGSFSWLVSGPAGTTNRVCVTSLSDPEGTDQSDVAFTIQP